MSNEVTVRGLGYIGFGNYSRLSDMRVYSRWSDMLKRVAADAERTVCDEWLNFQCFAKWYYDNYPKDGKLYCLDKDKIDFGNRRYCPDKCCFITMEENSGYQKMMHESIVIDPDGVEHHVFNQAQFCKLHNLPDTGFSRLIQGKYKSTKGWTLKSTERPAK